MPKFPLAALAFGCLAIAFILCMGVAVGQVAPQLSMQEAFPIPLQPAPPIPLQPAPQLNMQETFPTPPAAQLIMQEAFPPPPHPTRQYAVERPRSDPGAVARQKTVLKDEPGGPVKAHWERFQMLGERGDDVEIHGKCMSACTLVMAHIPKERLCFGKYARLGFHLAEADNGSPGRGLEVSQVMIDSYPEDIQAWLYAKGGLRELSTNFWIMWAPELWEMGYRRCR